MRDLLAGVKQRAEERMRDEFERRLDPAEGPTSAPRSPAHPAPLPRPEPDGPLDIQISNGKRVRARIVPAVARRREVAALAEVSAANDRKAFAEIRRQRREIDRLRQVCDDLAKRVTALQEQSDRAVVSLVEGLSAFRQKSQTVGGRTQDVRRLTQSTQAAAARQQEALSTFATNARIQQVSAAISSAQSAAYGVRGDIFAARNVALTGNQLFWTLLDPALRQLGIVQDPSTSVIAWLAPLGTFVTGEIAVGVTEGEIAAGVTTSESGGLG